MYKKNFALRLAGINVYMLNIYQYLFGCDIDKLLCTETIDIQRNHAIKIEYKQTPIDLCGFYSHTKYTNFQKNYN